MSRWIFVIVALLVSTWTHAQINAIPSAPHLLVKGHAEGHYIPDRFTIKLQVEVTDKLPQQARTKVEAHMQEIFAALDKSGALHERTQASSLRIEPKTEYRKDEQVFVGTEVSRSVEATFDSLEKLRSFIDQLQTNEQVQIQSSEVGRSDIDVIRSDLRKRAIANSQESAKEIAAAYGMGIKGVYSVSEVAPDFAYGIQAGSWNDGGVSSNRLMAVTVTGSNLPDIALRVGTIDLKQDIYAIYLTAP